MDTLTETYGRTQHAEIYGYSLKYIDEHWKEYKDRYKLEYTNTPTEIYGQTHDGIYVQSLKYMNRHMLNIRTYA
jgi:hypothetical protein